MQKFKQCEHIIIDGASTDDTVDVVRRTAGTNHFLLSERDAGLYDALNKGIQVSCGEVVGFLHSDDFYFDDAVLFKIASAFENPDVDIVYGDAAFFRENDVDKVVRTYRSGEFSLQKLAWGRMPAHPATFIRRRVYEKCGSFKLNYKIAADYEFMCRISRLMKLRNHYIPEVLVKMQTGGASAAGFKNSFLLNAEVLRACRENGVQTNIFKILSKYAGKSLQLLLK